ncbi:hypothetical protein J1P26_21900 [Neobacillus sp. MM2021_6]|uniref:hypothetical protein n=1 Tax=Bacillaceae TaxID=186817 RepID=UPI00140A539F|nr:MULTISPECIES: hypothetical protein [Bacillaceae]MBO0962361.1 hypothetical protein [Neobacillus sp. MM2021_6]NHC20844.1 hypothetical protein [Bacillus sp. MM2020_4]
MKIGTKVKMVNCYEARKKPDKVWVTRSEPWELGDGQKVVLLEGKTGGFSVDCLEIVEEKGLKDVLVFQVCECDSVAAYSLEEALAWYKGLTGLKDDELYDYDEIKIVPFDKEVWNDEERTRLISVREIIDNEWEGTPFIVTSEI